MIILFIVFGISIILIIIFVRKEFSLYLSWRIFVMNVVILVLNSDLDVIVKVLKIKIGVFINWNVVGKMFFSFFWIFLFFWGMCFFLSVCLCMFLVFGNFLGKLRIRFEIMRRMEFLVRYFSYYVFIYWGFLGLRLIFLGWKVIYVIIILVG